MKHVPHVYVAGWDSAELEVTPGQQHHISRVLRASGGDPVSYTDGLGRLGSGAWTGHTIARGEEREVPRPSRLVVAVAPPDSRDRVRFLVEKLAELGVEELRWFQTRRGQLRVPPAEKQQDWAVSALEQSRGAWLMAVGSRPIGWADLEPPVLVCDPSGVDGGFSPRTVVIGPEGGLDPDEVPASYERLSLGSTILRVETAAVVAAAKFLA